MVISAYIATSLDGFIARKNGALDWLPGSDGNMGGEDFGYQDFMNSIDVMVMGRNTFEQVLSFGQWPYGEKRVVVLSSHRVLIPDELTKTVVVRSGDPVEIMRDFEESGTKHIYVDGGKTIQRFLLAGLIDEITITRVPVLIGNGIPLFGDIPKDIELTHLNSTSYGNGFVQSKYGISRKLC
jgi:dihydrofolate reductase